MRVEAQSSQEEKVAQADVVIDTDGTLADTGYYFELAWQRLVENLVGPLTPAEALPPLRAVEPAPESVAAPEVTAPPADQPAVKAPPERLSASKASEIRQRLKAQKGAELLAQAAWRNQRSRRPRLVISWCGGPSHRMLPTILLLMQRATNGKVKMKRSELLLALGERGYFGQRGTDITAAAGWHSENLIACIDQFYVYPLEAVRETGQAVLQEIIDTANQLICECILAFPTQDGPAAIRQLFDEEFVEIQPERLPAVWKAAADESQPENSYLMLKILRDTRDLQSL